MKLTEKELKKIVPLGNMVLIKPERESDQIITESGIKLYIDPTFDEEKHAVRYGEVMAVPDVITYGLFSRRSIDWETDMELKVGDMVFINPGATIQAENFGEYIFVGEKKHYFIRYDEIYLALRKKKMIMLNGFILIKPVKEKQVKPKKIILPDAIKKKVSEKYGIVKKVGTPNRGYYFGTKKVRGKDYEEVKEGDKIIFKKFNNIPLEYQMHSQLGEEYYRIQRKNIVARVD